RGSVGRPGDELRATRSYGRSHRLRDESLNGKLTLEETDMHHLKGLLAVGVILAWLPMAASSCRADGLTGDFDVEFRDCVESIGVGLVPTDLARALVPPDVVLAGEGGPVTPIVVRTSRCGAISVAGGKPRPGTIVQIG